MRMIADNQLLGRSNVVQQYDLSLWFGGFLDAFAFLFVRRLYEYCQRYLGLHPDGDGRCGDR